MSKLASLPFLAHWAIEVRPQDKPDEWEGPTWEIRPTVDTDMRLEMAFGKWANPEQRVQWKKPYMIRSNKVKVGTTKLTDAEVNAVARDVLQQLIRQELNAVEKETLEEVKKLLNLISKDPKARDSAMEYFSETSTPDEEGRAVHLYNAAFKNCQDFAARIALSLCPEGILKRHRVRKALEILMTARKLAHIAMDSSLRSQPTSLRVLRDMPRGHTPTPYRDGRSHAGHLGGTGDSGGSIANSPWFINTVIAPPPR